MSCLKRAFDDATFDAMVNKRASMQTPVMAQAAKTVEKNSWSIRTFYKWRQQRNEYAAGNGKHEFHMEELLLEDLTPAQRDYQVIHFNPSF